MVPSAAATERGQALDLMLAFADRTGLTSDAPPDRYLWTDAFAVCNFVGLSRTDLALRLVDEVHDTLGRDRSGSTQAAVPVGHRSPEEAEAHPTLGGLRIGKRLPERGPGEPFDARLEWERDGQYFHYLTKWMVALDRVARATDRAEYNCWARELADVAHRAFSYGPPGRRRMYWKMSVDLSRPLVASMGHHDPLDGYVTCLQLMATAEQFGTVDDGPDLADAAADFASMIPEDLATADPLGIGGLLDDGWRLERLPGNEELGRQVTDAAADGLAFVMRGGELQQPADWRLAFRELGMAIGLSAVPLMTHRSRVEPFVPLADEIERFWLDPSHREVASWREHRNINDVMLATALAPSGYLGTDG